MEKLNTALQLAEAGLHVFPLTPGAKTPLGTLAPHGQDDATTDRSTIVRWWSSAPDANVGIATALSGLYVVDIDSHGTRKDGTPKVGAESWATLTEGREVPRTYSVRTQSGSTHLYFRMPTPALRNTASKLAADIDTRGNGYVVAPPSVVNGNPYTVLDNAPVADLPQWIVDALAPKPPVHRETGSDLFATARTHAPATEVMGRVRQLADELAAAPEGQGNDTASRIAFMVGGYVGAGQLDEHAAIATLLDAIAGWSWTAESPATTTENTIVRQVQEGAKHPRPWEAARFQETAADTTVTAVEEEQANPSSDWSTDDGQARAIFQWVGGMLYVEHVGWFLWDGRRWQSVGDVRIRHVVQAYYKSRFDHMIRKYMQTMDKKWNTLADEFKKFMASSRLTAILKAMESVAPVQARQLDAHPELLNTPAGIVNLRTGEVTKHDPALLLTKVTSGNYVPGYRHPDWTAALSSLPEDVQPFMQLRMGNAITGRTPESDDAIVLQGNGANGKSLMTSDGAMRALGDYAMLASPGLILGQKESGQATPERASLRGARFVLIEELPEGRSLSVAELKRIIGTDVLSARFLYGQEFTFHCSHTLFVTTNYLPTVNETDDGTWRRLCLIGFPYKFTARPDGPLERVGDPGMKHRVRHGAEGQHDAIVTWMVEGAMAYLADITTIMPEARPLTVVEDTRSWRMQADRIMAYLDARLVAENGAMVAKSDLFADFTEYLREHGHQPWSQELFGTRLQRHEVFRRLGLTETRKRGAAGLSRPRPRQWTAQESLPAVPRVITGVRFREDADDYADVAHIA
jgi:P4 family phage/plasmid primase-like protien